MIKLFHAADLHLDSPFSSLPPSAGERRREEMRRVFLNMMKTAAEEHVDLVLLPGDLFDSGYASPATAGVLREGFETVSCPVVICPGNHDPFTPQSIYATGKFPPNVRIFSSDEPSAFDFPALGVDVWGAAFVRPTMEGALMHRIPHLDDGRLHILCQHGDTRSMLSRSCPLNPRDIAYRGFCYAALGHVHVPGEPEVLSGCTVAYSGCPMGRSFDEPGWGGALIVTIEQNRRVTVERRRFATRRYEVEHLDVTGLGTDADVAARLRSLISSRGYGGETSLRVILEGELSPETALSPQSVVRRCGGGLEYLELRDRTLPVFDAAYLEKDMTLRGALYRELLPLLSGEDEALRRRAADALRAGLSAIDGRAILPDLPPESEPEIGADADTDAVSNAGTDAVSDTVEAQPEEVQK